MIKTIAAVGLALGLGAEHEYANTDGKHVHIRFRGLRQLSVIHEELEDGAELAYGEWVAVPEEELSCWVKPRERLNVFAPSAVRDDGPNSFPDSVSRLLEGEGHSLGRAESDSEGTPGSG